MSSAAFAIDASVRHQLFTQRFIAGEARKAEAELMRLRGRILERLRRDPTEWAAQRYTTMLADIDALLGRGLTEITDNMRERMATLAAESAEFQVALGGKITSVPLNKPSTEQLAQVIQMRDFSAPVGGASISVTEAMAGFRKSKQRQISRTINDGILIGDTQEKIAAKVGQVIGTLQRNQLRSLTRTLLNHASSVARASVYETNQALLEGYQWVATLDASTTLICGGRDGQIYPVGKGPLPPAHWGCRSVTVPVIKDEYSLSGRLAGERPAFGAEGGEQVSGNTNYQTWLKRQPAEFQDEVLGPARGDLFRNGGLSVSQFRDETGREYTLDTLRGLYPLAFQQAAI